MDSEPQPKVKKRSRGTTGMKLRSYSDEEIARALLASRGISSAAAAMLGCDYKTVLNHINSSPLCAAAQREASELMLDKAEGALFNGVDKEKPWAVNFYLSSVGRRRGYGAAVDVTSGGQPLKQGESEANSALAKLGVAGMKALLQELEQK